MLLTISSARRWSAAEGGVKNSKAWADTSGRNAAQSSQFYQEAAREQDADLGPVLGMLTFTIFFIAGI